MDMSDRMSTQGTSTMDVLRRKDAALYRFTPSTDNLSLFCKKSMQLMSSNSFEN